MSYNEWQGCLKEGSGTWHCFYRFHIRGDWVKPPGLTSPYEKKKAPNATFCQSWNCTRYRPPLETWQAMIPFWWNYQGAGSPACSRNRSRKQRGLKKNLFCLKRRKDTLTQSLFSKAFKSFVSIPETFQSCTVCPSLCPICSFNSIFNVFFT